MINEPLPLTGSDLRRVADAVDAVELTELGAEGILGRIEVLRPDDEVGEQIGWVARFDESDPEMGWGFVPTIP